MLFWGDKLFFLHCSTSTPSFIQRVCQTGLHYSSIPRLFCHPQTGVDLKNHCRRHWLLLSLSTNTQSVTQCEESEWVSCHLLVVNVTSPPWYVRGTQTVNHTRLWSSLHPVCVKNITTVYCYNISHNFSTIKILLTLNGQIAYTEVTLNISIFI